MSPSCAKCGSDRIVPRAEVWDRTDVNTGGRLYAYVYSRPDAILLKGTVYATLHARVCGDCGYTELYADGADDLYDAHSRAARGVPAVPREATPEPVPDEACLECGKTIPGGAKACPACGWTWEKIK